ncbi:MAG: hypothetical protein FJ399_00395 [Verrucomicrobia bacterium]|nr:hypothetical protein [Verrucomicrobiota bacterium]
MSLLTKTQLADLRFALLAELCHAHTVAFPAEVLLRRVARSRLLDFEVTVAEAEVALGVLHSAGYARVVPNLIDELTYWQATPAGVLAHGKGR